MALVIRPMLWPLRELATSGRETSTRGIPQHVVSSGYPLGHRKAGPFLGGGFDLD